jgi:PadR family transcriptional regulator, regulatory protein PadR
MISNELLSGSLKTIILKLLKEQGPMHGYAITQKVEELTEGKIMLSYGAIYPVLHKLKNDKVLVTSSEMFNNRVRVYYSLTPKGDKLVVEKIRELNEFIRSLQIIVDLKPGLSHA